MDNGDLGGLIDATPAKIGLDSSKANPPPIEEKINEADTQATPPLEQQSVATVSASTPNTSNTNLKDDIVIEEDAEQPTFVVTENWDDERKSIKLNLLNELAALAADADPNRRINIIHATLRFYLYWAQNQELPPDAAKAIIKAIFLESCHYNPNDEIPDELLFTPLQLAILQGLDIYDVRFVENYTSLVNELKPEQQAWLLAATSANDDPAAEQSLYISVVNHINAVEPYITAKQQATKAERSNVLQRLQIIRDLYVKFMKNDEDEENKQSLQKEIEEFIAMASKSSFFEDDNDILEAICQQIISARFEAFTTDRNQLDIFTSLFAPEKRYLVVEWTNLPEFNQLDSEMRQNMLATLLQKLHADRSPTIYINDKLFESFYEHAAEYLENIAHKQRTLAKAFRQGNIPQGMLHAHEIAVVQMPRAQKENAQEKLQDYASPEQQAHVPIMPD